MFTSDLDLPPLAVDNPSPLILQVAGLNRQQGLCWMWNVIAGLAVVLASHTSTLCPGVLHQQALVWANGQQTA